MELSRTENRTKNAWSFIVPKSREENEWLLEQLGFDEEPIVYDHELEEEEVLSAWLGMSYKKDLGWTRHDRGQINFDNFGGEENNRDGVARLVNSNGTTWWQNFEYRLARAYVICQRSTANVHPIHLGAEMFFLIWVQKSYVL